MGAHTALFHQQQVAGQGHGLGGFRDAGQAEEAGGGAFMGQAAFGQVLVLGVEDHCQVEGGGVFQGTAQGTAAAEVVQTVAESHAAGVAQGHQFGQLLASQALAQGADGEHLGVPGLAGAVEDQLGHGRGVQHRFGKRRAAQAGDATGSGRQGFAGDIALAAVARFTQGDVQIDQTRTRHQALGIDDLVGDETHRGLADGDNLAAFQMQVADLIQAAVGVDHAGAEDGGAHQLDSSDS